MANPPVLGTSPRCACEVSPGTCRSRVPQRTVEGRAGEAAVRAVRVSLPEGPVTRSELCFAGMTPSSRESLPTSLIVDRIKRDLQFTLDSWCR